MLSTTISTTRIPSAMHAHERMPSQFIRWVSAVLLTIELSGSFSGTLPTLGSEMPLDALEAEENPLELPSDEEGSDEETPVPVFTGFFELDGSELELGGAEEGGALLASEETRSLSGGEEPSGGIELSSFHEVAEFPAAKAFREHQQAKKVSRNRTDSAFSRRFIERSSTAVSVHFSRNSKLL